MSQSMGVISTALGDYPAARSWMERAAEAFGALPSDDPWRRDRLSGVLVVLGSVDFFGGDYEGAVARYREALADCIARDDRDGIALCELYIGNIDLLSGRFEAALALGRSSIAHYHRLGWLQYTAECLELIAFSIQRLGPAPVSARLIGAADAIRQRTGNPATLAAARTREERLPRLRDALGATIYDSELAAGRALSPDQAVAEALDTTAGAAAPADQSVASPA